MEKIVADYNLISKLANYTTLKPMGDSVSPKGIIFHVLGNNTHSVNVLDIGFGTGSLGHLIKSNPETSHWSIDGIDGWLVNCSNIELINNKIYRNIWHGQAEEISSEMISNYEIICLLDVIEHLSAENSKWLLKTLLTYMRNDAFLIISTPLWFFPQNQQQDDDLEEHLIGIPASSLMALLPTMYSINEPLVGGFVFSKRSLQYIEFYQPTTNKNFSYQMGRNILKSLNINYSPGVIYVTNI